LTVPSGQPSTAATSPVVLGLIAALLSSVALARSVDLPAIAYYQRF